MKYRPEVKGADWQLQSAAMIEEITPVIITYEEAPNIARTLDKLVWAKRIIIIDSGSNDETLEIACSYRQAQVIHRSFDDCASQWNFGNSQVDRGWILSLDADYELSDALVAELHGLDPGADRQWLPGEFHLPRFWTIPAWFAISTANCALS